MELDGQIPTSYKRAGKRWARKENPFPSDLNRHMVLQSKKILLHAHMQQQHKLLFTSLYIALVFLRMLSRLQSARHEGVWGMVVCMVEEEKVRAVVLIRQVLIQLGVDNGGKRSSMTLVGLHCRQCQTGEGGGGRMAPRVWRRQRR